eukprot:CAMPEP_0181360900 /NCGR_PEP_ID=MMETSP1106-20121128/6956_1 /TAXON_ID=81844 /ORGANISM="Mantoniella antarctica, Strain SL-175" /LENGTH=163 /DNA_ID=CAMNT_0023474291 /DNA_START=239 /DNA_END=731 /DNA_ORIENTATION=+
MGAPKTPPKTPPQKPNKPPRKRARIAFNVDTEPSHVGRLVQVWDKRASAWVHGAAVTVETTWSVEDYRGDGVECDVERHSGLYRLIYGRFEDQDAAQDALSKVIAREDAGEEVVDAFSPEDVLYDFDDLVKKGLLKFTDDLDKCMQPVAKLVHVNRVVEVLKV